MKIAMLARNPDLYSHKRIVEAAEARGHTIDVINTWRVFMNITSHRPELRYGDEKLTGYDAIWDELVLFVVDDEIVGYDRFALADY